MNTHQSPKELAIALLARSRCRVRVAAVLSDNHGVFAWHWNHEINNSGVHAEFAAIQRANKSRLRGATLTVVAKRHRRFICARPCTHLKPETNTFASSPCMDLVKKHGVRIIEYTVGNGNEWATEKLY